MTKDDHNSRNYPETISPASQASELHEEGHVQRLEKLLGRMGDKGLQRRSREAQRRLRENGATYNDFDPTGVPRTWQLDPVPFVIEPQQWRQLESGLVQRAELLDLILRDIYGSQQLVAEGLIPAQLIYAHKGFFWPCVNQRPGEERHLNLYSAHIAKGRDGRFRVLADHPQPPFGSGYALENRLVYKGSFSPLFNKFQVHRLAIYFRALGRNMVQLARHNRTEPRIVVLTPGPENPHYFEHSYLASYLGFPLVQGADLIVRDACVWLKSVDGLRQVDVILNRLDDGLCDPLELREDSFCGVTGLLEAIRRGNVVTGNILGSGVLNNPGLLPFLPALSRRLLGQELQLPSVATWWCGQRRECDYVLENIERLVIKPIHAMSDLPRALPQRRGPEDHERWRQLIRATPHLYIGQECSTLAAAPAFLDGETTTAPCVISTYVTADRQSYMVMPGALARVDHDAGRLLVDKNAGHNKDTWVFTDEPDKQVHLWRDVPLNQAVEATRSALPSRAAENLFWAGRYLERSAATGRLLRSVLAKYQELSELRDPDDRRTLEYLLRALTHVTSTYPGFVGDGAHKKLRYPRRELMSLATDAARPGTLRASLRGFAHCAYFVRDILPVDAWRIVDNIQQNWNPRFSSRHIGSGRLQESIDQLLVQLSAFSGLNTDNMGRENDWFFLCIGSSLERALSLTVLLQATLVPAYDSALAAQIFETVLSTSNSLITYRRRYRSFLQLPTILELLLLDEKYPLALAYQLNLLQQSIVELPHNQPELNIKAEGMIATLRARLNDGSAEQLAELSEKGDSHPRLEQLLQEQKEQLEQLTALLMQLYFSPTLVPRRLEVVRQERAS